MLKITAMLTTGAVAAALAAGPASASPGHLTDAHQAEHDQHAAAVAAEQERLEALSPAERAVLEDRAEAVTERALAVPVEEGGAWAPAFPHRSYGMHAAVLPTGKVLFWSLPIRGYDFSRENEGLAWLWDPRRGTGARAFENVDPPLVDSDGDGDRERAPIWCSGQSFLPDGRLLVAGGNREWGTDGDVGWEAVFTFNPWNETWARQPDMEEGRWYPSQVLTGEGETFIASGYTEDLGGDVINKRLERFIPSPDPDGTGGVVETLGSPTGTSFALYPHLFTLPDGHVAAAGPINSDVALLDTDTGEWDRLFDENRQRPLMSQNRNGGTAVLRPSGPEGGAVVTNIGGWASGADPDHDPSVATTETIDFLPDLGWPKWTADAPLNVPRANHNTVLLPDGGMVTVGGGSGRSDSQGVRAMYDDGRSRPVELRARGGGPWRLGAPQAEDRGYHSTASLLPDGRVLSAGDDIHPTPGGDTIEIYSPPYLFRGDRPEIGWSPRAIGYDDRFLVASKSPDLARAVLMAPSATTHATDMTQRHVELAVVRQRGDDGLLVRSPAHANLAPPGWHMLFLLDDSGVPSVARWVRIRPGVNAHEPQDPPTLPPTRDGLAPTLRLDAEREDERVPFRLAADERADVEARLTVLRDPEPVGVVRQAVAPGTTQMSIPIPVEARRRTLRLAISATDPSGNVRRIAQNLRP